MKNMNEFLLPSLKETQYNFTFSFIIFLPSFLTPSLPSFLSVHTHMGVWRGVSVDVENGRQPTLNVVSQTPLRIGPH